SHNFETLLINTQQQGRVVDDAFLGEVQSYQDQLVRLVDAVRVNGAAVGDDAFAEVLTPDFGAPAEAEVRGPEPRDADDAIAGFIDELAAPDTGASAAADAPRVEHGEPFARPAPRADVVPFVVPTRGELSTGGELEE